MIVDKEYCMSSFLMFRTIANSNRCFTENVLPKLYKCENNRFPIYTCEDLLSYLRTRVQAVLERGRTAIALSGGIDSAILAKMLPEGSIAYTFKCVVPGVDVIDETKTAKKYAEECGLEHRIVEIYWEDFEKTDQILMLHKGAPIHSIEIQIYKAAMQAKKDGISNFIFGEAADACYGGLSRLLSKDWLVGEFINRYSYVLPYQVLKNPMMILEPFFSFADNGYIDPHRFISEFFINESVGSYVNALDTAGIHGVFPYAETYLAEKIDYSRIRAGENKYIVREAFSKLYPGWEIPPKTPMPRPVNEWLKDWEGPTRDEFWPHCTDNMTGDQKWLVWSLERFLNLLDENEILCTNKEEK